MHRQEIEPGAFIGPLIGAAVAVATVLGYDALFRESERRRELIVELVATRADLAEAERTAGTLAERERLAREIHDTLAQGLSSIQLLLRAAERSLPEDAPAAAHVRAAREAAQANLAEARSFVRALTPPDLEHGSLAAALERLCARTTAPDLTVRFAVSGTPVELPTPYEVALLRTAQSALANTVRHARAGRAEITLSFMDTSVALDVVDDGQGFDPSGAPVHERGDGGFGLPHDAGARRVARRCAERGVGAGTGHGGGGHPAAAPDPARHGSGACGMSGNGDAIRLLLADDHPVVRAGLRAVLDTEPDFRVAGEAATAEEAVALAAAGGFDVVLMDLQFGAGMHGSEATATITAAPDGPRVLILTTYDSDADILAAVEAGASGYLLKDAPPQELAAAVRTAAAGRSALAPSVAHRLMDRMRTPAEALTRRELEVLQLVGEGLSNLQISKRLFLSQATVKSHLVHIYAKLGVDSRTSAVAAATARRLIRR